MHSITHLSKVCGLWVIMMCHVGSSVAHLLILGEALHVWGWEGGIWRISAPSSQFWCEPKTALKKYNVLKYLFRSSRCRPALLCPSPAGFLNLQVVLLAPPPRPQLAACLSEQTYFPCDCNQPGVDTPLSLGSCCLPADVSALNCPTWTPCATHRPLSQEAAVCGAGIFL